MGSSLQGQVGGSRAALPLFIHHQDQDSSDAICRLLRDVPGSHSHFNVLFPVQAGLLGS